MKTRFVIQSRESERGEWRPWTLLAPFSSREDAQAQCDHLTAAQPYPTRSWMSVRSFRLVEVPAGCPKCIAGAIGADCEWHQVRESVGATSPAPVALVPRTRSLQLSPRVRRCNKQGYSAEAIEVLRAHHRNGGAE